MSSVFRVAAAAILLAATAACAEAVTLSGILDGGSGTTFDADDGSGDTGPADDQASYTKTFSYSDAGTGVAFDVDLLVTAGGGFLDSANSGHLGIETTVDESGGTRALDQAGESITYSVASITQTAGQATTITFDGFTSINIRFAEGVDDAGQITDGSSTLFSFDNSDGTAEVTNASGEPFTVDVTGFPTTLVAEWVAQSNPTGNNRWRVNSVAADFSFEASTLVLGDTDGDGTVEAATVGNLGDDLGPIVANFFTEQTDRTLGDLVDDDFIDFLDFRQWKDNVPGGVSAPVLDYVHSLLAVPEPSSGLLAMFMAFVCCLRRKSLRCEVMASCPASSSSDK